MFQPDNLLIKGEYIFIKTTADIEWIIMLRGEGSIYYLLLTDS